MDQNVESNLDREFKKYLLILREYVGRLIDQNEIDTCNAWIKRLSNCKENEKYLRNKYVFGLCYQFAKGALDEPFLKPPTLDDLPPLHDVSSSDSSFTEIEYLVIDSENGNQKVSFDRETPSQIFTDDSGINVDKSKGVRCEDTNCEYQNIFPKENLHQKKRKSFLRDFNLNLYGGFTKCYECDEDYKFRANNLIMKLREIKTQNLLLHNELLMLRQESDRDIDNSLENNLLKVDNTTSTHNCNQESNSALTSLKLRLQEVQNSRNNLIETVGTLQDKLDNFNEIKKHEIDEIEAKHKFEMIKLKTFMREEVKTDYENKLNQLKKQYEKLISEIQNSAKEDVERFYKNKDQVIAEKDKLLQMKEADLSTIKRQFEELKNHQFSVLNRFLDGSNESHHESAKTYELEKRLYKMERTKNKSARAFEAKVASLQREKHLAECSLQLQLVKQRAQVLNEVTEENQVELATALDKLENKYKEIVANVQTTAVQRRIQDQIALEALIHAACGGISKKNPYTNSANVNANELTEKTVKNQSKGRHRSCEREYRTLCNNNRVDNVIIENKSFGEDGVGTGYCLDSVKLQELFEKVHIPQRDVGEVPK